MARKNLGISTQHGGLARPAYGECPLLARGYAAPNALSRGAFVVRKRLCYSIEFYTPKHWPAPTNEDAAV
jgi:hypothetical protein